jgi:hypothetical protein
MKFVKRIKWGFVADQVAELSALILIMTACSVYAYIAGTIGQHREDFVEYLAGNAIGMALVFLFALAIMGLFRDSPETSQKERIHWSELRRTDPNKYLKEVNELATAFMIVISFSGVVMFLTTQSGIALVMMVALNAVFAILPGLASRRLIRDKETQA